MCQELQGRRETIVLLETGLGWSFASMAAGGHLRREFAAGNTVFIFSFFTSHRLDLFLSWKAVRSVFLCINVFCLGM